MENPTHNTMTIPELQTRIRKLLCEKFSGGAKLSHLVAMLIIEESKNSDKSSKTDPEKLIDAIEDAIADMNDVGILEYVWPMGPGVVRSKSFVYFKP